MHILCSKQRRSKKRTLPIFFLTLGGSCILITITLFTSSSAFNKNKIKPSPKTQQPNIEEVVTIAARWRIAEPDLEAIYRRGVISTIPLLQLMPCIVIDTQNLSLQKWKNLKKSLSEPFNKKTDALWQHEGAEIMTEKYSKYHEKFMNYGKVTQENASYGSPFSLPTSPDASSQFIYTKNTKHCDPTKSLQLQDLDHTLDTKPGHSFHDSLRHIEANLQKLNIPYQIDLQSCQILEKTYNTILKHLNTDNGLKELLHEAKIKSNITNEKNFSNEFNKLGIEQAFIQYNPVFEEINKAIEKLHNNKS